MKAFLGERKVREFVDAEFGLQNGEHNFLKHNEN